MKKETPGRVIIFDTTLRDGEQSPGATMSLDQKLVVARQLALLGVDVIEAGFPASSKGDFDAVATIAKEVGRIKDGPIICALARTRKDDIALAGSALAPARRSRIHVFVATSDLHIKQKLESTREQVLSDIGEAVKQALTYTKDVEFSCEDGSRTDLDFMCQAVQAAVDAGATTINIPDTVGYAMPQDYYDRIKYLRRKVKGIGKCVVSVHCHDDLGFAVANSLAGVLAGARQVECTVNGIGERAGNASLEEIVMALRTRPDYYPGLDTGINAKEICKTSRLVSRTTGIRVQPNKAIVGVNAFAHEAGIHQDGVIKERTTYEIMKPEDVGWIGDGMVIGKHSGKRAFGQRLEALGFGGLNPSQITNCLKRLKELCDRKKDVFDEDICAIVEEELGRQVDSYELVSLKVSSATGSLPEAEVVVRKGGETFKATVVGGDGPIDALYRCLDQALGLKSRLLEYNLEGVTTGQDAQGRAIVLLSIGEREIRGQGSDTDVNAASVKAYLSAANRHFLTTNISVKSEDN